MDTSVCTYLTTDTIPEHVLMCRSQRPRDLRRRSAAERSHGSWIGIPPGAWMFVSCECLCCQAEVSAMSRSLVQRNPTDCGVSECDHVKINNLNSYQQVEERRTTKRNVLMKYQLQNMNAGPVYHFTLRDKYGTYSQPPTSSQKL
jgi:hypothetical protein